MKIFTPTALGALYVFLHALHVSLAYHDVE